jgi:hypothetical protein
MHSKQDYHILPIDAVRPVGSHIDLKKKKAMCLLKPIALLEFHVRQNYKAKKVDKILK